MTVGERYGVSLITGLAIFVGFAFAKIAGTDRTDEAAGNVYSADSLLPTSAIYIAKLGGESFKALRNEARSYSIIIGRYGLERYGYMRVRLDNNPLLKQVFLTSKSSKVYIFLNTRFSIGAGFVDINVNATDQEIIDFLLGEPNKKDPQ